MDLMESIDSNIRGITLNNQQIDLFNILKNNEESVEKIYEYLSEILLASNMESNGLSTDERIIKVVEEKSNISDKKFLGFLNANKMQIRANWDSRETLEQFFKDKGIDETYIDEIMNLKKYFAYQTHGILSFLVDKDGKTIDPEKESSNIDKEKSFKKVQALYDYVVGSLKNGEKRFTRLTLDGQGKFGTVAGIMSTEKEAQANPEDYNLEPLRQGYEFARTNKMNEVYINALVFFKDFPDRLVGGTKEQYETALINYGKAVASVAKEYEAHKIHTVVDMFNEFVDYNAPFSERTNNWMSKLTVEDLCKVAFEIKKEMPNADFGYNDWNFENSDKRAVIFEVIRKIQQYEKDNKCTIIDHIGTQCHTSINDIKGLIESINGLQQFGLPIDITELDISKGLEDVDYKQATPEELEAIRKYEQKLQNDVMKVLRDFAKEGKIRSITSWSITDELCCDFCDGKEASITGMSYDKEKGFTFSGKDMDKVIEMTEQEMKLIREHQEKIRQQRKEQLKQNPVQDFCYHTHTERCGHAQKDTGEEEYIENAIKGGIKKLAFTDHVPLPDGYNKKPNSRMDIAEKEAYLKAIKHYKKEYEGQIEIESGFEFEYSERDKEYLNDLRKNVDKMILGQHFVIDKEGNEIGIQRREDGEEISIETLELYRDSILEAIEEELPDVIAHPDLFMKCRNKFGDNEKRITRSICEAAIKKGIPLEINFGEIAKYAETEMSALEIKERIGYPSTAFWEFVAQEYGQEIKVIFGKDAHFPKQLSNDRDYKIIIEILGEHTLKQLHFVKSDLKTYDDGILDRLRREDGPSGSASGVHNILVQNLGKETLDEQKDTFSKDDTEKDMEVQTRSTNKEQKFVE